MKWMLTENEITNISGWPSTPVYNMIIETNRAQAKKLLEYLDTTRAIDMHVTIQSMLKQLEEK